MSHKSNRAIDGNKQGRHPRRRSRWLLAFLPVGLLSAGIAATSTPDLAVPFVPVEEPHAAARRLTVEVSPVQRVNSYQVLRDYTGTIFARRVSELSFERLGLLEVVRVEEGETVVRGAPLAVLDTQHLRTNRREVVARLAQAKARLEEMIAGPRREDIDAARATVRSLEADVELLKLRTERSRKLVLRQAATQDEFDEYQFNYKSRRGQLEQARHSLEELENGTRQEQIDAHRALVEQLNAAIEAVDVDLRKSRLIAPFSGTISRRLADEGTVVPAGRGILTIVEDSALEAWVGLPIDASRRMKNGTSHSVRISGEVFTAHVTGRRPEVDRATRTRTVILRLDASASQAVVHGQVVRLQLHETVNASGFWLPIISLTAGDRGLWSCLVAVPVDAQETQQPADFRVERRDVELLHTESNRVFVSGTLNSGDRVVTRGTHRVTVGQTVQITSR